MAQFWYRNIKKYGIIFYFGSMFFIICSAIFSTFFRDKVTGIIATFALLPFLFLITGISHEMHGCDGGIFCKLGSFTGVLNFWCRRK